LIGSSAELLKTHLQEVIAGSYRRAKRPELWDGRASQRIAWVLTSRCGLDEQ
jgi:hypothetical protein